MTTTAYPRPATGAATADPWDAPYFGGAVYFQYRAPMTPPTQAATPAPTVAVPTPSASQPRPALASDPWDAPYFGGPIYLRFPAFTAQTASGASDRVEASPEQGAMELATPESSQPVAAALSSKPTPTALETPIAEPEVVLARSPQRGRWGWLASLFGRG